MDPTENIRRQRMHAANILRLCDVSPASVGEYDKNASDIAAHAEALAELVNALDGWLNSGGSLPDTWAQPGVRA